MSKGGHILVAFQNGQLSVVSRDDLTVNFKSEFWPKILLNWQNDLIRETSQLLVPRFSASFLVCCNGSNLFSVQFKSSLLQSKYIFQKFTAQLRMGKKSVELSSRPRQHRPTPSAPKFPFGPDFGFQVVADFAQVGPSAKPKRKWAEWLHFFGCERLFRGAFWVQLRHCASRFWMPREEPSRCVEGALLWESRFKNTGICLPRR